MPKDIDMSQALRCASHLGVKLCGVHHTVESSALNFYKKLCGVMHTTESSSSMCILPRSQNAHCRVKIKIFASL